MSKRAKKKQTARIYYTEPGSTAPLYWTVNVTDAKVPVKINGTLKDALQGAPGSTVGCHLSLCAKRNKEKFPHPFFLAAFTGSRALVVDQVKNGKPYHAVRYIHDYGSLVELNDTDKKKSVIRAMPQLAEREFTLSVPWRQKSRPQSVVVRPRGNRPDGVGNKKPYVSRGALKRAVAAGFISTPVAKAIAG